VEYLSSGNFKFLELNIPSPRISWSVETRGEQEWLDRLASSPRTVATLGSAETPKKKKAHIPRFRVWLIGFQNLPYRIMDILKYDGAKFICQSVGKNSNSLSACQNEMAKYFYHRLVWYQNTSTFELAQTVKIWAMWTLPIWVVLIFKNQPNECPKLWVCSYFGRAYSLNQLDP